MRHGIFVNIFMPTTVHIPAALLQSVDRRAKVLGLSRNRLIIRALERVISERSGWAPEFFEKLRSVDQEAKSAVDELLADVKQARRSKLPHDL
jgi:metal-responsive CopG/Arc/MetJ family transcriptional regulator